MTEKKPKIKTIEVKNIPYLIKWKRLGYEKWEKRFLKQERGKLVLDILVKFDKKPNQKRFKDLKKLVLWTCFEADNYNVEKDPAIAKEGNLKEGQEQMEGVIKAIKKIRNFNSRYQEQRDFAGYYIKSFLATQKLSLGEINPDKHDIIVGEFIDGILDFYQSGLEDCLNEISSVRSKYWHIGGMAYPRLNKKGNPFKRSIQNAKRNSLFLHLALIFKSFTSKNKPGFGWNTWFEGFAAKEVTDHDEISPSSIARISSALLNRAISENVVNKALARLLDENVMVAPWRYSIPGKPSRKV